MNLSKVRVAIGWVLSVLLTLGFLAAATGKLTGAATQMFAHWGYPAWFMTFIGVTELVGGIGLLIPKTTRYAVLGLTVIMLGAAYTHLANHEGIQVLRPGTFLVVLWAVWWLRGKPRQSDRMEQTTQVHSTLFLVFALLVIFAASNRTLIGGMASSTMQEPKPAPQQQPSAQQEEKLAEQVYKNIQIMKGMPASRLMPGMTRLTQFLGVDCVYCHVPDAFDKDDKQTKQTARKMFQLVRTINTTLNSNHVTCYTCHRGKPQPVSMPPAPSPAPPKPETLAPEMKPADANVNIDTILDKYVQALGGKEALEKVTTRVMKGNMVTQGGMKAPLEVYEKAPNKTFTTFRTPNGVSIMGFNGAIGWTRAPEIGLRELFGKELNFRRFEAEFYKDLKIKERYPKMRLLGVGKLGDREIYGIEASPAEGNVEIWYFDTQSGLLLRIDITLERPGEKTTLNTFFEDYREVAGIKLPFAIRRERPGFTWMYKFDEIKLNDPVDDAKFNKPTSP